MANAVEAQIVGDALNDFGFEAFLTVEGLGLNSQGFLWPDSGIWGPGCCDDTIDTTWTDCGGCVGGCP